MQVSVLPVLLFGSYRQRVLAQLRLHPEMSCHVRDLAANRVLLR